MMSHCGTHMQKYKNIRNFWPIVAPCPKGLGHHSNRTSSKLVAAMIINPCVARRRMSSRFLSICGSPSGMRHFIRRAFHSPITMLTYTHVMLTNVISSTSNSVVNGFITLHFILTGHYDREMFLLGDLITRLSVPQRDGPAQKAGTDDATCRA